MRELRAVMILAMLAGVFAASAGTAAARTLVPRVVEAATAPAGYTIVESPTLDNPESTQSTGAVICPAGTVVWSGGPDSSVLGDPLGPHLGGSAPAGRIGWKGVMDNQDLLDSSFLVFAVCAKKPAGYKIVTATGNAPTFHEGHATATCPTGTVVLGGGFEVQTTATSAFPTGAWPKGSKAFTAYTLNGGPATSLEVYAVCGARPPGYQITSTSVDALNGSTSILFACPQGKSVIGGGIQMAPRTANELMIDSAPEPFAAPFFNVWSAEMDNQSDTPITFTDYGICAS